MSEKKKSGLRTATIATALVTLVALSALVVTNSNSNQPKYSDTAKFLYSKFQNGQFIEGFTPGQPEYGFSLEALAQLSSVREIDLTEAKSFLLEGDTDYLYSAETGEPIVGLVGKYLYTSRVTGSENEDRLRPVLEEVSMLVSESGEINLPYASTFDYAWLTLGLFSQGEEQLASKAATFLSTLAREDGGFGFDTTEATTASSVDATSMAIMALRIVENTNQADSYVKTTAIANAVQFLESKIESGNHFTAFDAEDVNGTALALMAMKSVSGELNEEMHEWLIGKIQSDAGIGSPWVENAGDVYATAQGYLALEGKSYLELLGR